MIQDGWEVLQRAVFLGDVDRPVQLRGFWRVDRASRRSRDRAVARQVRIAAQGMREDDLAAGQLRALERELILADDRMEAIPLSAVQGSRPFASAARRISL